MSLRGYVTALENENKMLRELWSNLGMPEPEYDCLGTEYTHSKKRREDFLRNVYTSDGVSACCDSEDYIVSDNGTKCCEVQYYNDFDGTCCEPPKELLSEEGLCCDEGKSGKTDSNSLANDKCCDVGPDGDGICCPDTTDSTEYSLQVIDGKSTCVRDCNGNNRTDSFPSAETIVLGIKNPIIIDIVAAIIPYEKSKKILPPEIKK